MSTSSSSSANVELIVGAYRSGKTDWLLHNLIDYSRKNVFPNSLLVVPSARYRELLNEKLKKLLAHGEDAQQSIAGIFGLRILTFYEACKLVLQTCGLGYRLLPDKMRPAIVGKVLQDMQADGKLSALAPIAALPGTHTAVLQLIDELERAALSPSDVVGRLKQTAAEGSRHIELSRIYESYWAELDRSGYTDEKRLAFTARELLFAQASDDLHLGWFGVDGFDRLSPLQIHVIKGFCNVAAQAFVSFDYVCSDPVEIEYQWKRDCYDELVKELSGARVNLLPAPPPRQTQRETFSTLDRFLEMDEIARRCKRLISEGCSADNLLVLARDLKPHCGAVEAAFSNAGIPYFIDEAVDLRKLPLIQLVHRLLKLHSTGLSRADSVACLRSPFFKLSKLRLDRRLIEHIDQESWDSFVVGGRSDWERCRERLAAASFGLNKLLESTRPPAGENSLAHYCGWVEDLLAQFIDWAQPGKTLGDFDPRLALAEIRKCLGYLIQQEQVFGLTPVSYDTFSGLFDDLLEAGNYRRSRIAGPAVTICGAELAPNRSFDHIFIAGMIEGEFPRRAGLSGFISSDEVARWAGFGIDISNPRYHPAFEQALYLSLVQRARRSIQLSYPRYEMDGEEVVPSFLLTEGGAECRSDTPYIAPYQGACLMPISAADSLSGSLWHSPDTEQSPAEHAQVQAAWAEIEAPLSVSRARLKQGRENLANGYLKDLVQSGALKMTAPLAFSISSLNEYGKCPFSYWAGRVLRLKPRPEHEPGLNARLMGQTYHKALELFYVRFKTKGLSLPDVNNQDLAAVLDEAAASAFDWLESLEEFHAGEFWEREKEDMAFRLRRFIQFEIERAAADEPSFQPAMFELRFGRKEGDAAPPLVLSGPDGTVEIAGIIDRIDVAGMDGQTFVRVIDYKTGTSPISEREAREGRNMQLPVYALAVQNSVIPGSRATNGLYLSVNSGKPIGKIDFLHEREQDILPLVQQHIREYVGGITSGVFTVQPNGDVCDNCDYKRVCRIAELSRDGIKEAAESEYSD